LSAESATAAPDIKRIPNPNEPKPRLAWPTVGVLVGGIAVWAGSTALALAGLWPYPLSVAVNTLATFALFTPLHEACHRTISTSEGVNVWLGRLASLFIAPFAGLGLFRFVHMQHHRFTNDHELDPDDWAGAEGHPAWQLPLRWLTLELAYMRYYVPRLGKRPRREKLEFVLTLVVSASILVAAFATGYGVDALLLWLLPQRIAVFLLGWSFDYLPHHELFATHAENPYQATRNRIGLERLLALVMLYQNYHLVHHLHPVIPFYRYIAVWRRQEDEYLARDPALSDVLGRPLTVEEYRQIRELAHH
jgi:fatty acid desaturase